MPSAFLARFRKLFARKKKPAFDPIDWEGQKRKYAIQHPDSHITIGNNQVHLPPTKNPQQNGKPKNGH